MKRELPLLSTVNVEMLAMIPPFASPRCCRGFVLLPPYFLSAREALVSNSGRWRDEMRERMVLTHWWHYLA